MLTTAHLIDNVFAVDNSNGDREATRYLHDWQRLLTAIEIANPPVRWNEVKAMTGALTDRPVGMSGDQFKCAQEHGEAYWLYVVENTRSPDGARIVRIRDPAGKARTFTFDHGWLNAAEIEEPVSADLQEQSESE